MKFDHIDSQVDGRALKDSIRITSTFPEMEKTYSSLNILKYVKDFTFLSKFIIICTWVFDLDMFAVYRYDIIVDIAPEVKWVPENGYKNLKIVVELDNEIDAKTACERELKRRYKSLSTMRIVTNRGLQVIL